MTCDVSWYQSVAQTRLTRIPAVQRVQRDVPEASQPRMHYAPCFSSHHPRPHTLHQLRTGTPLECRQTPLPYAMRIKQRCRLFRYWIRTCRATEIANYNARHLRTSVIVWGIQGKMRKHALLSQVTQREPALHIGRIVYCCDVFGGRILCRRSVMGTCNDQRKMKHAF